ncbi:MAG: GGDEF domain-containing protein [Chloroflexi bacterium]|nr:GGDEF domain-containing protein [Chloroflexota bacterium]
MKNRKPTTSFAPYEIRRFILPLTVSSVIVLAGVIADNLLNGPARNDTLVIFGLMAIGYIIVNTMLITKTANFQKTYGWVNSIFSGVGLGLLNYVLPDHVRESAHLLIVFGIVAVATSSGRVRAYFTLLISLAISLLGELPIKDYVEQLLELVTPFLVSIIVSEAFFRIQNTTQQHIHRLETINKVSRQIMMTLDTEQTISLVNATIQNALEADTYFVGIVKNNEIHLDLFYDDGEYFNGMRVPLEGTLSGWVIKNQKELFLPDLREEVQLEGVQRFIIGKERTSLSWMGVPLKAANVTGIIALGSYSPNAFDLADMELLSNLAQHITLALDNTIRHSQVEEQARLDSMTGVYNHGYFLKKLSEQAEECASTGSSLGLIMLDIDYFKQYNDTYGHLVGDKILNTLCAAIKRHIKQTDTVGRWGGEEFIIALPGATGEQAMQVAQRVGETMMSLRVEDREKKTVPVPTVSQGIAVFPHEADEIYRLIDLADRRLYTAKERGRNQIEPDASHWQKK